MKHIFYLVVLFLAACSSNPLNDKGSPSAVAAAFAENLNQGKLTEAKKLATEGTHKVIDLVATSLPITPEYKVEYISDSVAEMRAYVLLKEIDGDTIPKFHLVKIDNEWKVDLVAALASERKSLKERNRERLKKLAGKK